MNSLQSETSQWHEEHKTAMSTVDRKMDRGVVALRLVACCRRRTGEVVVVGARPGCWCCECASKNEEEP